MHRIITSFVAVLLLTTSCVSKPQRVSLANGEQTEDNANEWFNKKEWLGGLNLKPHESIDRQEFAKQYQNNKQRWDKAFAYLKTTKLADLTVGDHPIEGENVFARVTEAPLKDLDKTRWEAHKNYTDIHLMIRGKEKIGVAPFSSATVVTPYDPTKDIGFYNAEGKFFTGDTETFFILFPKDAHRPGIKVEDYDVVKKVVIKIRTAS